MWARLHFSLRTSLRLGFFGAVLFTGLEDLRENGIRNIGNTCYMSVVLLLLLLATSDSGRFEPVVPPVPTMEGDENGSESERRARLNLGNSERDSCTAIAAAFRAVRERLTGGASTGSEALKTALMVLQGCFGSMNAQQDAHQFLLFLIRDHPLFRCFRRSSLRCLSCNRQSNLEYQDLVISLEPRAHKDKSLSDCIRQFSQPEHVRFDCTCGCNTMSKREYIAAFPEYLIFHLSGNPTVRPTITFPSELPERDLSRIAPNIPVAELPRMHLCCVVFYHYGGARETGQFRENGTEVLDTCGHYTAAIKSPAGCSPKWRLYNDSHVSGIVGDMPGNRDAYMLVYHTGPLSSGGIPGDTAPLSPAASLESDGGSESAESPAGPVGQTGTLGTLGDDDTREGADHEGEEEPETENVCYATSTEYNDRVREAQERIQSFPVAQREAWVLSGYTQLNAAWRALVQRPPDHLDIVSPFLWLVLRKARKAAKCPGSDGGVCDGLCEYIMCAESAHPHNELRAETRPREPDTQHADDEVQDLYPEVDSPTGSMNDNWDAFELPETQPLESDTEHTDAEEDLDLEVREPTRPKTRNAKWDAFQLLKTRMQRDVFTFGPLANVALEVDAENPASGRFRRPPAFLIKFLHGPGSSYDASHLMETYDEHACMPGFVYLVLRRLFPAWSVPQLNQYIASNKHQGTHDLEDTLVYCTLSRTMFDWFRSVLHVHFEKRYFTDLVRHWAIDLDEGRERLALQFTQQDFVIPGLSTHDALTLFDAVVETYKDTYILPGASNKSLSLKGISDIMLWMLTNGGALSVLSSSSAKRQLCDLLKLPHNVPALHEIIWYVPTGLAHCDRPTSVFGACAGAIRGGSSCSRGCSVSTLTKVTS